MFGWNGGGRIPDAICLDRMLVEKNFRMRGTSGWNGGGGRISECDMSGGNGGGGRIFGCGGTSGWNGGGGIPDVICPDRMLAKKNFRMRGKSGWNGGGGRISRCGGTSGWNGDG